MLSPNEAWQCWGQVLFLACPCREGGRGVLCTPEWVPAALPCFPAQTGDSAHGAKRSPYLNRRLVGLSALAVSAFLLCVGKTNPETSVSTLRIQMKEIWSDWVQIYHSPYSNLFAFHSTKLLGKRAQKGLWLLTVLLENPYFWFTWQKTVREVKGIAN